MNREIPDDTLVADDGDLSGRAVFHHVQQRYDRGGREIHMAQRGARFVEHFAEGHLDGFELRQPLLLHGAGQRGQQVILVVR